MFWYKDIYYPNYSTHRFYFGGVETHNRKMRISSFAVENLQPLHSMTH